MIIKTFELKKTKLTSYKFFLIYGNNKGLVEEIIENNFKTLFSKNVQSYDENDIIQDTENFQNNILNKSFFDNKKLIIISRITEKILKIIEEIIDKNFDDIWIILKSSMLEKKSKIRNFFEKDKRVICIPVYEDTFQALDTITKNFIKENNINLSQQIVNFIIERAKGDRINLKNELNKLKYFSKNKKKIELEEILKLTNLAENYDISELVNNSLAQNVKKTLHILNENNFASEDCIIVVKIYLAKLKRLLKIKIEIIKNNNIEKVISSYKPPIFWKEKEIVKQQVKIWDCHKIENLIINTNELEYQIKKNPSTSTLLLANFIIEKTLKANNSL